MEEHSVENPIIHRSVILLFNEYFTIAIMQFNYKMYFFLFSVHTFKCLLVHKLQKSLLQNF